MTGPDASLVERLCEAENPRNVDDWEDRDGYYVAACRVSAEDTPGLIDIVRRWSDPGWPSGLGGLPIDQHDAELLPVTAWRTLADLKADTAVQPLVDLLCESDEFDDWTADELPHVFGKIGQSAIGPLTHVAKNDDKLEFVRSIAARGLRCVADYHADTRDCIVACLTEMMANAVEHDLEFNTTLLNELVELRAVEAAEAIERAFAGNLLDIGLMGNWEDVRRVLGVQGLGLKMPEHPHNSVEQFRMRMGIGIFSGRVVFALGEIDHEAELAYYKQVHDVFSKSSEAQQVVERHGDMAWFRVLLEFGVNHRGEIVEEMTLETVQEFVLDFVPRKVSTEADAAASIICELSMFWQYLDRVYELPEAKSIVEWLTTNGLLARLEAALSDPANFGMAKSMFMLGKSGGYDMTSDAGVNEFMMAFNRSVRPAQAPPPAAPAAPNRRIGRNAPCSCGSGKKYKKCCGR